MGNKWFLLCAALVTFPATMAKQTNAKEANGSPVTVNEARKYTGSDPVFLPGSPEDADAESEVVSNQKRTGAADSQTIPGIRPSAGGIKPADPNNRKVREIAQFATETIAEQQNQVDNLYLIEVTKAATQVVAGTNFFLTLKLGFYDKEDDCETCELVVFDQPWTNTRELKNFKCVPSLSGLEVEKTNRLAAAPVSSSGPMPGGITPVNPNNPVVQDMAEFATETIAEQQNQVDNLYLIEVTKAATQVVAGTNFYLTMKIGFYDNDDDYERCECVVFDQPWTNTRELKNVKCVVFHET